MLTSFPAPVLSVTADAVKDLQGHEALSGLWTLFTKCKESLEDGRRLENISWRLWHRELVQAQVKAQSSPSSSSVACPSYQPLTPVSMTPSHLDDSGRSSPTPSELPFHPNTTDVVMLSCPQLNTTDALAALGLPSPTSDRDRDRPVPPPDAFVPLTDSTSSSLAKSLKSHCVGRVIVEMLPHHLDIPKPRQRVASTTPTRCHQRPISPAPSHASQASYEPPPSPSTPHHHSTSPASHEQTQAPPTSTSSSPSRPHMQSQAHFIPQTVLHTVFGAHNDKNDTLQTQVVPPVVHLPSTPPSNTTTVATVTPSVSVSGSHPSDQGTAGTSTTAMAPYAFPRVVVVNPTPHPTPPTTPILGGTAVAFDGGGQGMARSSQSSHLLPPLPLPGPAVLSGGTGLRVPEPSQGPLLSQANNHPSFTVTVTTAFPYSPVPDTSSSLSSTPPADTDATSAFGAGMDACMARTPGEARRFFLQQSPEEISPDPDGTKPHQQRDSSRDSRSVCSPVSEGKSDISPGEDKDGGNTRRTSMDGSGRGAGRLSSGRLQRSRQGRHAHTASKTKMKTSAVVKEKGKERVLCAEPEQFVQDDHHQHEDGDEDQNEDEAVEECDKRSASRMQRGKGKDAGVGAGKVSAARLRRTHSARHPLGHGHGPVAPLMQKRSSTHEGKHQPHPHHLQFHQPQHKATFNVGSPSSGGSKSTQSTAPVYAQVYDHDGARAPAKMRGPTADTSTKPPLPPPFPAMAPDAAGGLSNGYAMQGNAVITTNTHKDIHSNAMVSTDQADNVQPNGVQQSHQGRKTIVVASTSEEYETTDGSDSEWASEEVDDADAEKKRQAKGAKNKSHVAPPKPKDPSSKPNSTPKATEETRLCEAALEAQRQREMFAKVPKRSYSNLNRTQSGLLSQLMNPNPAVLPAGHHPYRPTRSSQDIGKVGLTMTQMQAPSQGLVQGQMQGREHPNHVPQARVPQRSNSAFAAPTTRLSTSKSAAALPMAAQVTAISSSKPPSSGMSRSGDDNKPGKTEKNGGYRPKGRPQEEEMEDDSGEENEHDQIPVSRSVAQEKLQALMTRRSSRQHHHQEQRPGDAHTSLLVAAVTNYLPGGSAATTTVASALNTVAMATPTPIPLGHPYNLPAPAPPMTPRTTRRRMLRTELSESMRRQLLWERQVSSTTNPAAAARRTSQGGFGSMRPLTMTTTPEAATPARGGTGHGSSGAGGHTNANANEDREERRRRVLSRNWTWADDYHFAGW